ncbi:hypothetical protein [Absidia glauca]|uniref:3-beta hydroxysteroid dehydrogenase/isomerase domain-containing protein n=1 Tax=Absidia glauca TaxID=4829 RepID=A0A168KUQ2_ABSGL|nr:hypothetical protein [Absidia glauca]
MQEKVVVITGVSQNGVGQADAGVCVSELYPGDESTPPPGAGLSPRHGRSLLGGFVLDGLGAVVLSENQKKASKRYQWIDYLFLNAGHLDYVGVNWHGLGRLLWNEPIRWMEHSGSTLQDSSGELTKDGLGKVFASNVFGHYTMIRELESLLAAEEGRIIWTSSSTAQSECFDIEDWQGLKSETPYESSKWACDLLSVAANDYFMQRQLRITSFTISPGVVSSRIGNFPLWILYLRTFLHYLYTSATNRWGTTFVKPILLDHLKMNQAWTLWDHCEDHYQTLKHLDDSSLIDSANNRSSSCC